MKGEHYDTIAKVVEWYRSEKHFDPTKRNIEYLLAARRRLVGALMDLGQDIADLKAGAEAAYFNRKNHFAGAVIAKRKEGETATDAQNAAQVEGDNLQQLEVDANAAYIAAKNLKDTVQEVLNAIAGDLRILEYEYQKANYQPAE